MSTSSPFPTMAVQQVVGYRMRLLRKAAGLTGEQFGRRLGALLGREWARQSVSAAEQGHRAFTAAEVFAIATLLGVKVGALFAPPPEVWLIELPSGYQVENLENAPMAALSSEPEAESTTPPPLRFGEGVSVGEIRSWPAAVDFKRACDALGIGRTKGYELARAGAFPVRLLRLRGTYRVPTAELLTHLGISGD
jgi:transcriptional regulator with XRE-family HTH domain